MIAIGWIVVGVAVCIVAILFGDIQKSEERAAQDEIDPFEGGGPV